VRKRRGDGSPARQDHRVRRLLIILFALFLANIVLALLVSAFTVTVTPHH